MESWVIERRDTVSVLRIALLRELSVAWLPQAVAARAACAAEHLIVCP